MKEQQKKHLIDMMNADEELGLYEEPKQEALEEASWKFNPLKKLDGEFLRHAFKEGARWQQERMYSEEDMREAYKFGAIWDMTPFEEFINQFKKQQ